MRGNYGIAIGDSIKASNIRSMKPVHMHPESCQNASRCIVIGDYGIVIGVYCIMIGDTCIFKQKAYAISLYMDRS